MLRLHARVLAVLLPFTLGALALAQTTEPGYTSLFDGSDLTGWRYGKEILHKQTETPDKRFYVSGGVIVMAAKDKDGKKDTRELVTIREFNKDFILKFEFKAAQEAKSSLVIRTNAVIPVDDYIRRGEQKHMKKFQNDGWNEMEVVVKMVAYAEGRRLGESDNLEAGWANGRATAKVNGRSIDPNRVVIQIEGVPRVNGESMANPNHIHHVNTKGQIALRTGSGKVEFRNIRFKELH